MIIIEIDFKDPLDVFAPVAEHAFAQLLYSAPGAAGGGRYSTIAVLPFDTILAKGTRIETGGLVIEGNPFKVLDAILNSFKGGEADPVIFETLCKQNNSPKSGAIDMVPGGGFAGGLCGYFGYELLHHLERVEQPVDDDLMVPELALGLYDVIVRFDHVDERAFIISTGLPEQDLVARGRRARQRADDIISLLSISECASKSVLDKNSDAPLTGQFLPGWERITYQNAVQRAIDYIHEGDVFQSNISQRFMCHLPETFNAYDLFCQLAKANPVSYNAYLNFDNFCVVSNSPEQFLKVSSSDGKRHVLSAPIKGTIARKPELSADLVQMELLRNSEKDRAENVMIVDLMRNDLSRVCEDNSIEVCDLWSIESYAHIHHMVSRIEGQVRDECSSLDVLAACFPGGSITGAPKIRAMEIISELEQKVRGPYCGAIGYLGFDQSMETSIAIRTLLIKNEPSDMSGDKSGMTDGLKGRKTAYLSVGCGIVADSDPQSEYEECLNKARPFFDALGFDLALAG